MVLAINETKFINTSRLTAIKLAGLTLRCMENWRKEIGGYDETMILVAVAVISSQKLTRDGPVGQVGDLSIPLPADLLSQCNVSSIAAATGLNRETTRRKICQLVDAGLLVREGERSVAFPPGLLQEPRFLVMIRSQLESIRRVVECFFKDDVFRLGPTRPAVSPA